MNLYKNICNDDENSRKRELVTIRKKIIQLIHKTSILKSMYQSLKSIEIIYKILDLYASREKNNIQIIKKSKNLFESSEIKLRRSLEVISESLKCLNGENRVSNFTIQKIVDKGVLELDRADYNMFRKHYALLLRVLINKNLACQVISDHIHQIGEV